MENSRVYIISIVPRTERDRFESRVLAVAKLHRLKKIEILRGRRARWTRENVIRVCCRCRGPWNGIEYLCGFVTKRATTWLG